MLSVGLVGLPNAGKSTLFNLLTKRSVPAENFPFTTIDPNDGIVEVPDERLAKLSEVSGSDKIISASIEFRDIAGLIKNAHAGEGLGNQFLSHIRETDVILMILRKFENENVVHVENRINPQDDFEILMAELVLADEKMIQNIIPRLEKEARKDKSAEAKIAIAHSIASKLANLEPAISFELEEGTDEDLVKWRKSMNLLTDKQVLTLGNINLDGDNVEYETDFELDILLETDLADMSAEERVEFGAQAESSLDTVIKSCYKKLNLSSYLTTGEKETRAWTFRDGFTAPQCAGVIHTDFEKGFVKAEVVNFADFMANDGFKGARESGKVRSEGKGYLVQDGDICEFIIA